ncbi:MAG: hypothetical protein RL708_2131 [Bacteroidota bacterium]|jgi:hypothetical protein
MKKNSKNEVWIVMMAKKIKKNYLTIASCKVIFIFATY